MQRPVMNPGFEPGLPVGPSTFRRLVRGLTSLLRRAARGAWWLITYDPLARLPGFRAEDGTATSRVMRALMYRLAFVPVLIAISACAIVWVATHPRTVTTSLDPGSSNLYYEPVTFLSADNTRLEGWLIPSIDAKNVLEEKDKVLWKRHAAVVLIHDIGQRRDQMLPLIKPLHDAGYVVLAVNLRGGGSHAMRGETFGLHESLDVKAAVELLRRRPFVDPKRIAVVGYGTGATAALLAAQSDAQIAAVVADRPVCDSRELVQTRILPQVQWIGWMAPLCKWTFEISYGVDAEELQVANFRKLFDARPVLLTDAPGNYADPHDPQTFDRLKAFLDSTLAENHAVASVK